MSQIASCLCLFQELHWTAVWSSVCFQGCSFAGTPGSLAKLENLACFLLLKISGALFCSSVTGCSRRVSHKEKYFRKNGQLPFTNWGLYRLCLHQSRYCLPWPRSSLEHMKCLGQLLIAVKLLRTVSGMFMQARVGLKEQGCPKSLEICRQQVKVI